MNISAQLVDVKIYADTIRKLGLKTIRSEFFVFFIYFQVYEIEIYNWQLSFFVHVHKSPYRFVQFVDILILMVMSLFFWDFISF